MNFYDYRDRLLSSCRHYSQDEFQEWQSLGCLITEYLKKYLGFREISAVDDPGCPFDIWGISHGTLYMVKIDDEAFIRDTSTVGGEDLKDVFNDLFEFVKQASEMLNLPEFNSTRSQIAGSISLLARGQTVEGIERIKIMPFVLNPLEDSWAKEASLKFGQLRCKAQAISLYTLWQHGYEIPELSEANTQELLSSEVVSEVNGSVSKEEAQGCEALFQVGSAADGGKIKNASTYKQEIITEARNDIGLTTYNIFDRLINELQESGTYEEIYPAHCRRSLGSRPFAVDGWSLDEVNNVLTLFILDDNFDDRKFIKTDIEKLGRRILNFIEFSFRRQLTESVLDLSTEEGSLSYRLEQAFQDEVPYSRIDCVILTLREKSMLKNKEEVKCEGVTCRIRVLDYADLYELALSAKSSVLKVDFLDPDFGGLPVQLISAVNRPDIGYQAYVGKIRADVLSKIYEEYGQRALASNVRAFLLTQVKVNKGIQKTIKEEPANFFAYNNGICVVASAIEFDDRSGITLMKTATDFQIVNGGQTTASLHYAAQKKEDISNIYVPIKLSVVPEDSEDFNRDVFVQKISEYANSQNKVSDSDLGSNTQFQINFQKAGEACRVFSEDGLLCGWYYERTRGTYKVEKMRVNGPAFVRKYPQNFDKTDLAKWLKSWSDEPNIANLGGQKCFINFSKDLIKKEEEEGLTFCNADFFKYSVGKGILYRFIDQHVANSQWYKQERSYKVNIVGYSMGLLRLALMQVLPGQELNFIDIWKRQRVPGKDEKLTKFCALPEDYERALRPIVDMIARYARATFDRDDRLVSDVGEWVKKEACWQMMLQNIPDLSRSVGELRPLCCPIPQAFVIPCHRD